MDRIQQYIEALIFASDTPVGVKELVECLGTVLEEIVTDEMVHDNLEKIKEKYTDDSFAFELIPTAGGYQFLTKSEFHKAISLLLNLKQRKKLSGAALETLSIIAYKQPVTKSEIEQIRGVNCDYTVQKLLEKDLIEIAGKKRAPGNPVLYEISQSFLDYFGLNSAEDLPKLRDIEPQDDDNTIGLNPEMLDQLPPTPITEDQAAGDPEVESQAESDDAENSEDSSDGEE